MGKTLFNGELDLSVENWWNELDMNEQNLLINMLYNMGIGDFETFGVEINDKTDKYVSVEGE